MRRTFGIGALTLCLGLAVAGSAQATDCEALNSTRVDVTFTFEPSPGPNTTAYIALCNEFQWCYAQTIPIEDGHLCLAAGTWQVKTGGTGGWMPLYQDGSEAQPLEIGTVTCLPNGSGPPNCSPTSIAVPTISANASTISGTVRVDGEPVTAGWHLWAFAPQIWNQYVNTEAGGTYTVGVGVFGGWSGGKTGTYKVSAGFFGENECATNGTATSTQPGQADLDCWNQLPTRPPCPPGTCCDVGAPVNVLNGNVWLDQTEITIPGLGRGLHFSRSYNSANSNRSVGGAFGRGWHHAYETSILVPDPSHANVLLLREGDGEPKYYRDPTGGLTFQPIMPVTEQSWIVKSGTGTYTRYFKAGGREEFNASGKLTSQVAPSGNTTTLTYDGSNRLSTIGEQGGRTLTLAYNAYNRIQTLSGPLGVIAQYSYDSSATLLTSVSYPDGSGYNFQYASSRLTEVSDFSGRLVERHEYDASGRGTTSETGDGIEKFTLSYDAFLTTVTDALGNVTTYESETIHGVPVVTKKTGPCSSCGGGAQRVEEWTYDADGHVLTATDANGKATIFTYDAAGNRLTSTNALNQTTTYTYDSQNRMLTRSGPDGSLVTYTHGNAGPLTITEKVTTSQNRTTTIAYKPFGKLETITDPRTKVTTLAYNANGDITSVTDPLTHATSFGYDALGRRTTVTDALTHATTTTYDARGRVTRITSHDGTHTDFEYDFAGRRTKVTDPMGRETHYVYDAYGRLERVVDPMNQITAHGYDLMSHLTSLTDANGHQTAFEYDGFGRVTKVTYPGGAYESFTYSAAGRLATKVDRKNVVTTYAYDDLGRLTGKTYSNGDLAVSYTYDTGGRLLTAANGTDTLTWAYDLAGQLLSEQSTKNASTVAYTYDNAGNRLSVSLDGTLFVSYGYDDTSRLLTITRGTNVFGFGYDNANRRTSMTYPNGVTTAYTYDDLNRLLRLKADKGATPITDFQYLYDAAGNRTKKQQLDYTEDYGYDALYRLTDVVRSAGLTGIWRYGYDPVGNRLYEQKDDGVTSYAYNEKNQLLNTTGGGTMRWRGSLNEPGSVALTSALVNGQAARILAGNVFEADIPMASGANTVMVQATDVNGNVTTKSYSVSVSGTGATYTYDANGNLATKVDGPDTWAYEWNAENQLKRATKNAAEVTRFAYDPLGRRVERTLSGTTTTFAHEGANLLRQVEGVSVIRFISGLEVDDALALEQGSSLSYWHADGLGSIVKTSDASGATLSASQYEAFGDLTGGSTSSILGYTGTEVDPAIGLYYRRFRYYEPRVGRFVSEDPIGFRGGTNFYSYVGNDPVSLVDPFGLQDAHHLPPGGWRPPRGPDFYTLGCQRGRTSAAITIIEGDPDNTYGGVSRGSVGAGCSCTLNWMLGSQPKVPQVVNHVTGPTWSFTYSEIISVTVNVNTAGISVGVGVGFGGGGGKRGPASSTAGSWTWQIPTGAPPPGYGSGCDSNTTPGCGSPGNYP